MDDWLNGSPTPSCVSCAREWRECHATIATAIRQGYLIIMYLFAANPWAAFVAVEKISKEDV